MIRSSNIAFSRRMSCQVPQHHHAMCGLPPPRSATTLHRSSLLPKPSRQQHSTITCMAHPRRIAKVSKQIEREIGNLFTSDRIIQEAICPEKKRGLDGAISALASITEVALSRDLQVAKVYISIYSDEAGRAAAAAGLQRLEGYVRRHVGNTVRLRLTPEIRLIVDDSIERSERMYKLLERARAIEAGEIEPPPIALPGDDYVDDEEYEGGEVGEEEDGQTIVDLGFFDDDEMVV